MTTLIGWISIDPSGPTAAHIASDSRITWGSSLSRWDAGRKVFACQKSADVLGYCGDVAFPALVLSQITDSVNLGLIFSPEDDGQTRHQKLMDAVVSSFDSRHRVPLTDDIWILHIARDGEQAKSRFRFWMLHCDKKRNQWSDWEVTPDLRTSGLVVALGTGESAVRSMDVLYRETSQGDTSRAVFWAFCDALRSGKDPLSGGPPQLVSLYRKGGGISVGTIHNGGRFLYGLPVSVSDEINSIEWRDEKLQRMDGKTLELLDGAQRHGKPKIDAKS